MSNNDLVILNNEQGRKMIVELCEKNGITFTGFQELIEVEIEQSGKQSRRGLWDCFDDILDRIYEGE